MPKKQTPKNKTNVLLIKLYNGDDIITAVEAEDDYQCTFVNPMKLIIDTDLEFSRQVIIMYPWIPQGITKKNSAEIPHDMILFKAEIMEDVKKHYENIIKENGLEEKPKRKPKQTEINEDNVLVLEDLIERMKKGKPIH